MWQEKEITGREKLSAVYTLLLEIGLVMYIALVAMLLLGAVTGLVAHFFFGYSRVWERAHVGDALFFFVLIATPLLLASGVIWIVLRNEYRRILQARARKW